MASFIEILQLEMQSNAFLEILYQQLPHITTDEQKEIMQEILEMAEQSVEICDNAISMQSELNVPNEPDFQDAARLALKYLQQFVYHIANVRNVVENSQAVGDEQMHQLLSADEAQSEADGLNFWLSAMRPEDEFMLEEEPYALENSSREDEVEEHQWPRSIEDVWVRIVQSAGKASKSAGAA